MTEDHLQTLHQTIFDMMTDLENVFSRQEEKGDLGVALFYIKKQHPKTILKFAKNNLLPHKEHIENRSLDFFIDNTHIFMGLPDEKVDYYTKEIVKNERLSEADMDMLWEYLSAIIALVECSGA